jgi:type I restriction enzyme S subunit
MSWDEVLIKDVAKIVGGYSFKSKDFTTTGEVPVIKIKSLKKEKIVIDNDNYIDKSFLELDKKYHINYNDILIALTGSHITLPSSAVGRVAKSQHKEILLLNQRVGKFVVDPNLCYHDFLFYILISDYFFQSVGLRAQGAASQANISGNDVGSIKINLPPLQAQKRIADILSAYDDLIENNLKRIKLLEQAAQNIYKEWFVNLRFPGYENAPINEETGLPEGWEEKALGDFTEIKKGKNITRSTIKEGNVPVVAGGLKPAYYHNTSNTSNPVITVSASGANAGYVNMYLEDIWASDCSYIDSNLSDSVFFIHNLLLNQQELIFGMQRGAAQPHVYPKDLKRAEFVIPDKGLIQKFEEQVSAQYDMKRVLLNQNQKLKAARDILLPRLMNRTIEV